MMEKGTSPKIICITSGLGSITRAQDLTYGLSYGMSKAALNMGVKKLSSEMAGRGIIIVALHPGLGADGHGWRSQRDAQTAGPLDQRDAQGHRRTDGRGQRAVPRPTRARTLPW